MFCFALSFTKTPIVIKRRPMAPRILKMISISICINGGAEDLNLELLIKGIISNPKFHGLTSRLPFTKGAIEYDRHLFYSGSIKY